MGKPLSVAKAEITAERAAAKPRKPEKHENRQASAMKRVVTAKAKPKGITMAKPRSYQPGPLKR